MISSPWMHSAVPTPDAGLLPARSGYRILVIANEPAFTLRLRQELESDGHLLAAVDSPESGLVTAHAVEPDLVLADMRLMERAGVPVLSRLRASGLSVPMLLVGAMPPDGVVDGFRVGTDEFLRLPVSLLDLHARIDFMLRRITNRPPGAGAGMPGARAGAAARFRIGEVEVFPNRRVVVRNGSAIPLTHKEYGLLMALVAAGGAVVSRHELLREVWGRVDDAPTRTVEAHVLKLRNKVESDGRKPRHILAVPKVGYRFQQ
jgi:DNA-binding response OmpR family regulator